MKLLNSLYHLDQHRVKKHLLISFPGIVTSFLLYYYFVTSTGTTDSAFSITEAISASVCGIFIAYVTYGISKKIDRLVPWNTQLASRFLTGILIHFFVAFISIIALYFMYKKMDGSGLPDTYQNVFIKLAIVLFIIMLIYNIVYFALYSYYTYSIVQIEAVTYERKQIDLQLKALKSQLSAHFLFNNLNTISSLAFKDAKTSEQYIRGLAKVYKYALNSYHSKLVLLHEELSMLKSYLLVLKTRYGDLFNYNLNIHQDKLASKVPPLTLQMLVENIIKHNVIDADNVLYIDIFSDQNFIIVKNNITKAPKNVSSFHIGLNNIESRYQTAL